MGNEVGTGHCAWGCPCPFNALPTYGRCEALLANGFEFERAEMANCIEHRAHVGDNVIANTNCYAQFCSVDWTNA
jgi:hypothetical protein